MTTTTTASAMCIVQSKFHISAYTNTHLAHLYMNTQTLSHTHTHTHRLHKMKSWVLSNSVLWLSHTCFVYVKIGGIIYISAEKAAFSHLRCSGIRLHIHVSIDHTPPGSLALSYSMASYAISPRLVLHTFAFDFSHFSRRDNRHISERSTQKNDNDKTAYTERERKKTKQHTPCYSDEDFKGQKCKWNAK